MKLDQVKPVLLEVMRLLGLDCCKCEVVERPLFEIGNGRPAVDLCFWFPLGDKLPVEAMRSPAHFQNALAEAIGPLRESIMRSPEVSGYVGDLERRAREAEALVQELRPYKIHFEMEMQLRHGRQS